MPASDLTNAQFVEQAIAEADRLGPAEFRELYKFGEATRYLLAFRGKLYDSKAILNVAIRFERGAGREIVSGGHQPNQAAGRLEALGFTIVRRDEPRGRLNDPQRHFVYYWRAYRENVATGPLLQLNQGSPMMREVAPGDVVWAITNTAPGTYALATRFAVSETGVNPPGSPEAKWGSHFFRSSKERVVYFQTEAQPTVGDVIVRLGLADESRKVGLSFQGASGLRPVMGDPQGLNDHARASSVDPGLTDPAALAEWAVEEAAVPSPAEEDTPARREYRREMMVRNRGLVNDLKRRYGGVCQISGDKPLHGLAGDITEAHHIQWLTRGGRDKQSNMVLLSPDWHAAVHAAETEFDWSALAFVINGERFPLRVNHHLKSTAP